MAVPVTDSMAASRIEAARPSTALEIEPSMDSSLGASAGGGLVLDAGCSDWTEKLSESEGTELNAEAATEPRPMTALPRRLNADAPSEDVVVGASSGGGGSGSSSSLLFGLSAVMSFGFRSESPKLGRRSAARREAGDAGGETVMEIDGRLAVGVGGSFETGAARDKNKERALMSAGKDELLYA